MIELTSYGDRIIAGAYSPHSRFQHAVNFSDGDRLVAVVDPAVGAGPVNLVVSGVALSELSSLRIQDALIWLDDCCLTGADRVVYNSGIGWRLDDHSCFYANLDTFQDRLLEFAPRLSLALLLDDRRSEQFRTGFEQAFRRRMIDGAAGILAGDLLSGVAAFKGCGFGLTPSGDDFNAGLLVGLNLAEQMHGLELSGAIDTVFRTARSESLLCDSFLRLARDGRVAGHVKALIEALGRGTEREIRRRTAGLLAAGETSGADFATGFVFAVRSRRWLESIAAAERVPSALTVSGSPG